MAGLGKKNVAKFFEESEDVGFLPACLLIAKFSVPILGSVAVAQFASRLDYAIGAFSPTITGLAAGAATFLVAYMFLAVATKLLRESYISGRKIVTQAQAKRHAAKVTGQAQPQKATAQSGLLFGGIVIPYQFATDHFWPLVQRGAGRH